MATDPVIPANRRRAEATLCPVAEAEAGIKKTTWIQGLARNDNLEDTGGVFRRHGGIGFQPRPPSLWLPRDSNPTERTNGWPNTMPSRGLGIDFGYHDFMNSYFSSRLFWR